MTLYYDNIEKNKLTTSYDPHQDHSASHMTKTLKNQYCVYHICKV